MEQQFSFAPFACQCKAAKTGADGAILELSNFEPGGPLAYCRRPFQPQSGWWELRMSWDRPFDQPFPLPSGAPARTLRDAGNYIRKLSQSERDTPEWRL